MTVSFFTVMIPWAGWVGHDDLHTTVWCVILPLTLLSIAMADVVGVLFVKLNTAMNL